MFCLQVAMSEDEERKKWSGQRQWGLLLIPTIFLLLEGFWIIKGFSRYIKLSCLEPSKLSS